MITTFDLKDQLLDCHKKQTDSCQRALRKSSGGNVSEIHICESDALVDLFGHWLTSSETDPLTVCLWAVNLPSGCKLMPVLIHPTGHTLFSNRLLIWLMTRKVPHSMGQIKPWTLPQEINLLIQYSTDREEMKSSFIGINLRCCHLGRQKEWT